MKYDNKTAYRGWEGLRWNREVKRLMVILLLTGLVGIVLCNLLVITYRRQMNEKYVLAVAAMVGSVKAQFPSVPEEEVFQILNSGEYAEPGRSLLE